MFEMTFFNKYPIYTALRIFVFYSVIFSQYFLPIEIASPIIVSLGLIIMLFGKIQSNYFKTVWPLLGVLLIGVMGINDHETWHILRDVSFALSPIFLIYIGHWMIEDVRMWPLIQKMLIIAAFLLAINHLKSFILNPYLLTTDISYIRKTIGAGSGSLVVIALVLGIFKHKLRLSQLFPRILPRIIVIPVLSASFILSFSRTELMVAIVMSLSLLVLIPRVSLRSIFSLLLLIVCFNTIFIYTPAYEVGTFIGKIKNSISEISFSDYRTMSDINLNWRGYESFMAVKAYSSGNIPQLIFGQGFGSLIDVGLYMPLGGEKQTLLRYIPVLHNGYAYILVKTGSLGLLLYFLFYFKIIKFCLIYSKSLNHEQKNCSHILMGLILSLISTMYVIGGMAEMHCVEMVLLLGCLMRLIVKLSHRRDLNLISPIIICLSKRNYSSRNLPIRAA